MKIKFILVPAAIVVAIVITIWHIWPAWFDEELNNSVATLKKDIKTEQVELDNVKQRKQNVDTLDNELQRNIASKDLVFGYYPIVRKEEDIINKINHIALGSGIFLTEMVFEYGKVGDKNDSEEALAIPVKKENVVSMETIKSGEALLADSTKEEEKPNFITAEISTYGDYGQIKNFLQSLYAVGLLNNVQSFDIHKEENAGVEEEEGTSDNRLNADIKVSFGYIAKKRGDAVELINDSLFAKNSFNLDSLNEKKDLMSKKYPNSEIGERGIANPFAL